MNWQVVLIVIIAVSGFLILGYAQIKMIYYRWFKSFKPEAETLLQAEDSQLLAFNYPNFEDWKSSPYSMIQIRFGGEFITLVEDRSARRITGL